MIGFAGRTMAVVAMAAAACGALAQGSAKIVPQPPSGVPNVGVLPPAGYCDIPVSVWTDRQNYQEGTAVTIFARTGQDAWIYVYSTDSSGITHQLFPNGYDSNNFVRNGTTTRLPSSRYRLVASGSGYDTIQVIAVSGGSGWNPPRTLQRYSQAEPFPTYKGGVPEAREELQKSMPRGSADDSTEKRATPESGRKGRPGTFGNDSAGSGIDAGAPGEGDWERSVPSRRGCWGEASTQIYVYPTTTGGNPVYPPTGYPVPNPPGIYPGNPWVPAPGYPQPGEQVRTGTLRVTSSPTRADVFVNGYYQGKTPLTVELPRGYYDVTVRKDDYEPYSREVGITEGKRSSIQLRLKR